MKQFIDLVNRILEEGREKKDRTGVGTISIFGHQSSYEMKDGFPLLTLKKTWFPGVAHELIWFLGNHMKLDEYKNLPRTNTKYLTDNKVHIWDEWADEKGNLGPVYGEQWTSWEVPPATPEEVDNPRMINQIQQVIDKLNSPKPEDRGIIVSAWNVSELDRMALRPCHSLFQFYAEELTNEERNQWHIDVRCGGNYKDGKSDWKDHELDQQNVPKYKLSLQLYQRSADTFLGVPFNIASYSLLLHMVAHVTNMVPGKFVHTFGDAHLYLNHKDQVNKLLQRTLPDDNIEIDFWSQRKAASVFGGFNYGPKLPKIELNSKIKNIFDFQYNDIKLINYNPLQNIIAPIAI